MMYLSILLACAIAWYANRLTSHDARSFITGPAAGDVTDDDGNLSGSPSTTHVVRPGSGQFFDGIASTYDMLNEMISLGYQRIWRETIVHKVLPADTVLDVSTGTADVAILLATKRDASRRIVALDPSAEMLAIARRKLTTFSAALSSPVDLVHGVAEALPFPDASFNAVTVAFGVRNFEDRAKGLREISRVLIPGGKLAVLELSLPDGNEGARGTLAAIAKFAVQRVMPVVAGLVSGNAGAYRYLGESMGEFPGKEEFEQLLTEAGLVVLEYERLAPLRLGPELYIASKPGTVPTKEDSTTQREQQETCE